MIIGNPLLLKKAADSTPADPVTRSLRFGSGAYLSRTFGTPTDAKKKTISVWVKRSKLNDNNGQELISYQDSNAGGSWQFSGAGGGGVSVNDDFTVNDRNATTGVADYMLRTKQLFRDPAAWYHIFIRFDTTISSPAADRCQIWVNGERVTDWNTGDLDYPDLNHVTTKIFAATTGNQYIGTSAWDTGGGFEGYMADFYFTDGTAYDVTDFAETDPTTGQWVPKTPTGLAYGNNGFHIDAQPAHDAELLVSSVARNDGDTTFADAAAGHTITKGGDPEHSIAVGNPFTGDGRAIYFDGTDDYLTVDDGANIDLGTGDFTVEFWVNSHEDTQNRFIMGRWNATPNNGSYAYREFGITMSAYDSYGFVTYAPSFYANYGTCVTCDGKWHHIALVRSGGDAKAYVDGKYIFDATYLDSADLSFSSKMLIGAGQGTYWEGAMYDFRISDTARYTSGTSDFDVPTEKFTSDSDTLLLIQPDKDDTTFHDESSSPATVTTVSAPTRKASTPYEAAAKSTAIYIPASSNYSDSNYLETSVSTDFSVGTGAYTFEGWIYIPNDYTGNFTPFGHYGGDITMHGKTIGCYAGSAQNSSTSVDIGEWKHVAVVRESTSSNGGAIYYDGNRIHQFTHSANLSAAVEVALSGQNGQYWNQTAYYYDVRLTKGTARYTGSTYTVPEAPFELNPVYIGGDQSGNKNHFTPTNINSHDVLLDVPTKNYAVLNPLQNISANSTLSEGNLKSTWVANSAFNEPATIGATSGKYYFEVYVPDASATTNQMVGIARADTASTVTMGASSTNTVAYMANSSGSDSTGYLEYNGSSSAFGSRWDDASHIVQCAFDADTGKVWFGLDNTWQDDTSGNTPDLAAGTYPAVTLSGNEPLIPAIRAYGDYMVFNGGSDPTFANNKTSGQDTSQSEFYYAPPTGFKSLNTSNLADPTVTPEENFNIALYNGNSSSNAITGLGFEPSLLWTKSRSTSGTSHKIYDSVRGVTKKLEADNTTAEGTVSDLTSFDSDGFTLGSGSGSNYSGRTYVGWNWKAHQSPTSSSTRTTYTVKVEDSSNDAWDAYGSWYDSSTYLPSVYMEIFENRNSSLVSLGKVAVYYYDSSGISRSDISEQTYTLECADLNAIAVKWHYDTSGDGQEYDSPNNYNDYLNEQKITILEGSTSEWTTNNYSNDDGSSYNYSPPTGWANGDTLKSATTSYNGSDTATLTSSSGASDPVEKYNAAAGFTIISYSGDGSSSGDTQELDHSLGVPLEFVIAKARTNNDSYDNGRWIVYHKDLTSGDYLMLNSTAAADTPYEGYDIISTSVSGSQHKVVVGNDCDSNASYCHYLNSGPDNGTGEDYILYGWAGVEGYSKFGSYTGNGSSDGPMVHLSFRPKFFMYKQSTGATNWVIVDAERETYNTVDLGLFPNLSTYEQAGSSSNYKMDFLSNGVKIRTSASGTNANNQTFIYAAFAESPFKHANAR